MGPKEPDTKGEGWWVYGMGDIDIVEDVSNSGDDADRVPTSSEDFLSFRSLASLESLLLLGDE